MSGIDRKKDSAKMILMTSLSSALRMSGHMPSNNKPYTISLKSAADLLGKSERTVQRYVKVGRLSVQYVSGPKGRELRFNKDELLQIATTIVSERVVGRDDSPDREAVEEKFSLNINELLTRHEQAMYRLGQLEIKAQEVKMLEERAASLIKEKDELEAQRKKLLDENASLQSQVEQANQREQEYQKRLRRLQTTSLVMVLILLLSVLALSRLGQDVLGVWLGR